MKRAYYPGVLNVQLVWPFEVVEAEVSGAIFHGQGFFLGARPTKYRSALCPCSRIEKGFGPFVYSRFGIEGALFLARDRQELLKHFLSSLVPLDFACLSLEPSVVPTQRVASSPTQHKHTQSPAIQKNPHHPQGAHAATVGLGVAPALLECCDLAKSHRDMKFGR